jgi:hypothetical protein
VVAPDRPRVGVVGLGYWGPNLARNLDYLADLRWLCDLSPELPQIGLRSVELDPGSYDCVVIVTDHSGIDYARLVEQAGVVVDFRNATKGVESDKVWKL